MDVMQKEVVSVVPCNFKQEDGSTRRSWRVYLKAEDGAIGSVYSNYEVSPGDMVKLGLMVNRDGKFAVRIIA